jgi:hypothetical protein
MEEDEGPVWMDTLDVITTPQHQNLKIMLKAILTMCPLMVKTDGKS